MLFANENVDSAWGKIARSIAFGPLKDVGVTAAKVAPKNLYEPDVRDSVILVNGTVDLTDLTARTCHLHLLQGRLRQGLGPQSEFPSLSITHGRSLSFFSRTTVSTPLVSSLISTRHLIWTRSIHQRSEPPSGVPTRSSTVVLLRSR